MDIKDLTGLGKVGEKFLDVVAKGAGALYKPYGIRREGQAEADKLLMIERAKAQAEEDRKAIAIAGQINRLSELTGGDPQIIERAKARLLMQELQGQQNIEAIADEAIKHLPSSASDEPVADEWRQRFFKYAADVSTEDMQLMWAKILAGEIAQPKTFSPRSLDVLHNLTQNEAEVFTRFLGVTFSGPFFGAMKLNSQSHGGFRPYGIPFDDVITLKDAGLLAVEDVSMNFDPDSRIVMVAGGIGGALIILEPAPQVRRFDHYLLTRAGQDLKRVVQSTANVPYFKAAMEQLAGNGIRFHAQGNPELVTFAASLQPPLPEQAPRPEN